jgi:LysR family transcriptional regulator, repressor for citA
MDIKWLQTFVAAARTENFRSASEMLFLSQPTVTVHIRQLEERLGIALFARKGRHVELTRAGHRFLIHAEQMLTQYTSGMEDMESWKQGYERQLKLAVSPLVAASVLPPIVRRFVAEHIHIEVVVNVEESKHIEDLVHNGEADLGLSLMPARFSSCSCQTLYEEPVLLVAAHDGKDWESSPPLDADELLSTNRLLTHNHPFYWETLLGVLHRKVPRLRTMVVSQVHITKRFIEEGLGISFLPGSAVNRELLEGRLLQVDIPDWLSLPLAGTYAVWTHPSDETELFLRFIGDYV